MQVEVVYAQPLQQDCVTLELPEGATVADAIARCGVLGRHPEIDPQSVRVGIWGRRCTLATGLREGDRIELYRPLRADPKEVRRQRAGRRKR